jgi:hypothetical protein
LVGRALPAAQRADYSNSRDAVTLTVDQITCTADPDEANNGHTIPDWQLVGIDQQTGIIQLLPRFDRAGEGSGRTYTITVTAEDGAGDATTRSVQVKAPHDRGK